MRGVLALLLTIGLCVPVSADTLADVRQDLASLLVETKRLQLELDTTQGAGFLNDTSILDRTSAIENDLRRLTNKTERFSFQISAFVIDATRRIGDLEKRLCALETDCKLSELGATLPLELSTNANLVLRVPQDILTITEQSEFDSAERMSVSGHSGSAILMFESFIMSFPIGPLTQKAYFMLGNGYMDQRKFRLAARSFLEAYSRNEDSEFAPKALFNLAMAFKRMGKTEEGCLTLNEIQRRFGAPEIKVNTQQAKVELACS